MAIPERKSRRTADAVYRHLLDEIVSGRLSPDEKLSPAGIAEALDVSRTPVRESILRLESEGLVERIPYRGVVVSRIDFEIAEQTTALRIHLEGLAVALAVPRLTALALDDMEDALDELEGLDDTEFTPGRWNELNDRFHARIHQSAGAPVLVRPLETLAAQASRIRMHFDARRGRPTRTTARSSRPAGPGTERSPLAKPSCTSSARTSTCSRPRGPSPGRCSRWWSRRPTSRSIAIFPGAADSAAQASSRGGRAGARAPPVASGYWIFFRGGG